MVLKKLRRLRRYTPDENRIAYHVISGHVTGGCMIDVGAHYGESLAPFAAAGWRVHAFEPDPENRRKLLRHHGAHPRVVVDPRAVSDRPAKGVDFFTSPTATGISALIAFHGDHAKTGTVDTTTIAEYVAEHRLAAIDFLKIDAEGCDLPVLRGVPFDRTPPKMVLCEFEDVKTRLLGYGFHDMAGFLVNRGYRVLVSEWYPIVRYGTAHRWRRFFRYPGERVDEKAWGNFFATRDRALFERCVKYCRNLEKMLRVRDLLLPRRR